MGSGNTDVTCCWSQLEIYHSTEPVPDSLVLAGLDLEQDGFVLNVLERLVRPRCGHRRSANGWRPVLAATLLVHTGPPARLLLTEMMATCST